MIGVALCTWHGERHLPEQLDSIAAQSAPAALFVHDDASDDRSVEIARAHPAVTHVVAHSRNVGHVRNFERALAHTLESGCEHVAFADQDDVWRPERLARGLDAMRGLEARHGTDVPLLVHSDLAMIDSRGRSLHPSFVAWRGYAIAPRRDLPAMLGQCGVMGNTCLVNRALAELALPFPDALHVHDWWLGLLAELHGARAYVDAPLVDYRIHADNASNALDMLDGGAGAMTAARLLARDFRLPFHEDTRREVLDELAESDPRRRACRFEDRRSIDEFRAILHGEGSAVGRAWRLVRGGYLRPGRRHRLRVAAATIASARYGRGVRG